MGKQFTFALTHVDDTCTILKQIIKFASKICSLPVDFFWVLYFTSKTLVSAPVADLIPQVKTTQTSVINFDIKPLFNLQCPGAHCIWRPLR